MKFRMKGIMPGVMVTMLLLLLRIAPAVAQSAPQGDSQTGVEEKTPMADQVFKNVQLLKGISVKEFMNTMGFFSASTGMNCIDCHSTETGGSTSLDAYAIDTPMKQITRKMILMVNLLDKSSFGGKRTVTCYTCHRATDHPEAIPSLLDQYSVAPDDPDRVEVVGKGGAQPVNQMSADKILDKYIQAVGGAAQAAKLTSFFAKGTYEGYETFSQKVPFEIYAQAPNQLTTIIHTQHGDSVATYDGMHGWTAAADKLMSVLPLAGGDLTGAKLDGSLSFPVQIKRDFKWRTGFPSVAIDDRPVEVIQEASGGDTGAKLYFDKQSGLLVRQVRYSDTIVGVIPTQIDYSDYRDVSGVKTPFHIVWTWTDGQSTIALSEIQPNARIDAAKFAKPVPPQPPKSATARQP
jgi:photosynthetic reaction center cytochrome c subunit